VARVRGTGLEQFPDSELILESDDSFRIVEYGDSRVKFTMQADRAAAADVAIGNTISLRITRVE
jgi:hypothetical protein